MTYSLDLINACINYYKIANEGIRNVAKIFGISKSVLQQWLKSLPIKYLNNNNNNEKNNSNIEKYISFVKNSLNHNPFQTQKDILFKINKKFNVDFSVSLIKNILKNIGYTKKKVNRKLYNKNLTEHKNKQKIFKKEILKYNQNDIICIDEVGVTKDTFNQYGYCHKSKRLRCYVDMTKLPQKRSIIVAISNDKIIHYKSIKNGNANSTIFKNFITELTAKVKNKIILMDNVSFHKSLEIKELIKNSQNEQLFIPPYSPEFNPIEEVFSQFKSYLRKKINVITGFVKLDIYISDYFATAENFEAYYKRSFC